MLRYEPLAVGFWTPVEKSVPRWHFTTLSPDRSRSRHCAQGLRIALLLTSDLLAIVCAFAVGYACWASPVLGQDSRIYLSLLPLLPIFPLAYTLAAVYPGFGLGAVETLRRLSYCTTAVFVVLSSMSFALKLSSPISRVSFVIAWSAAILLVPLMRFILLSVVHTLRWWGEPTVVVGTSRQVERTIRSLKHAFSLGYSVVGALCPRIRPGTDLAGVRVIGGMNSAALLRDSGVTTALVWDSPGMEKTLDTLSRTFRHVVIIRDGESMPLEHLRIRNLGGVLGIELRNKLLLAPNRFVKRMIDLGLGVILALFALPLILIAGAAVKLASPGPMFFRQNRVGLGGRTFSVLKLRTMHTDAEQRLQELIARNPEAREQWTKNVKLRNDIRIIPVVGHFLRRFSIDELPQLFAVINGTMSLVGPRPFPSYHMELFPGEFAMFRCSVRPGLTGMWQVMTRSDGDLDDQMLYDKYYIRNWSVWFDLYLLARTAFTVLSGNGSR